MSQQWMSVLWGDVTRVEADIRVGGPGEVLVIDEGAEFPDLRREREPKWSIVNPDEGGADLADLVGERPDPGNLT